MKTLHFEISINAPKEKVWNTMLDAKAYELWSAAFNEGSHFVGSWSKGAAIRFLDPEGNGMISEIAENKPHEFISIRHLGFIMKGVDDTESESVKSWAPSYENYTFTGDDKKTTVAVQLDVAEEWADMMNESWPKALAKLKEICE